MRLNNMRRFIIDTDTAADDAAALVYMLRKKDIKIEAITTVSGNISLDLATDNALSSVEAAQTYDAPVYAGCSMPILHKPYFADYVHGKDGLGDSGIKPKRLKAQKEHAVDVICDIIRSNPHEIELLTLGPLTNIALAYLKHPEIAHLVKNVVVMGGGGFGKGNVTDYAEFNIYVDAEAAKVVTSSGMPLTFVGWELSADECGVTRSELEMLRDCGDCGAKFVYDVTGALTVHVQKTYGRDEAFLPDAVAAAVAVDASYSSRIQPVFADVEAKDDEKYGWLEFRTDKEPNAYVAHKLDSERFKKELFSCLKREEI